MTAAAETPPLRPAAGIRVLIVDDNPADVDAMVAELRRGGFVPEWTRVDTEPAFLAGLASPPDLIVASHTLRQFSAARALELLAASQLDVPLIVVAGTMGEAVAVECLRQGAEDCLLADQIARLAETAGRAIRTRALREANRRTEAALEQSQALLHQAIGASPAVVYSADAEPPFRTRYVSDNVTRQLGYTPAECLAELSFWIDHVHPGDRDRVIQVSGAPPASPSVEIEYRFLHKDGAYRWVHGEITAQPDRAGRAREVIGFLIDVTARKRAEDSLASHDRYFRDLIENGSDIIAVLDMSGTVTYVSPAFERVTGFRTDDIVGQGASRYVHPSDVSKVRALVEESIAKPVANVRAQLRHEHRDGSWRVFEAVGTPLVEHGVVTGAVVNARDVTDRRRAESDRREAFERLRVMFEQAAVGIAQIASDGRFLQVNDRMCDMFGYAREQLLERTLTDLGLSDNRSGMDSYAVERRCPRKDGGDLIVSITASYLRDESGSPRWGVVFILDITRSRQAEEAVEREHAFRRAIEDSMTAGVIAVDAAGRLSYMNRAFSALVGWTPEELQGTTPPFPFWAGGGPDVQGRIDRAVALHEFPPSGIEARLQTRHGDTLDALILLSPLDAGREPPGGWLASVYDLTERKQLEDQLRQAQKLEAVGRLAGGVAHDFNNLLTAITGYSELLLEEMPEGDRRRADVEEIRHAGESAATLTRQLLAFSRRQALDPTVLDLNIVIAQMLSILQRTLGEDVTVDTDLSPDLARVLADRVQLEQVIMNLSVNSRDAMPRGGRIRLRTANVDLPEGRHHARGEIPAGTYVLLTMADTGVGMDAGVLGHVFEPFFTTKPHGTGTGLGLAVVYGIVAQSGGHVGIDTVVGEGTTLFVYLPVSSARVSAEAPAVGPSDSPDGSETVLVVEDNAAIRSLAAGVLRAHGYTVLTAGSGEEAMALTADHADSIDLLLTDVVMPGMSGVELAERLHRLRPALQHLYMSGYADAALEQHGLDGQDGMLLEKPFTPANLLRTVRKILNADPSSG